MSPRRQAPSSPQSMSSTRSTRSTRSNNIVETPSEAKSSFSQRRPVKSNASTKKPATKRVTRANQSNGNEDEASESGTDADNEDGNNNDDDEEADKPVVEAPSGMVTRRRGHQTGLSLSLSTTSLTSSPRGIKRELSTSTVDGGEARPQKQQKKQSPVEDESSDDDAYNAVNDISESEENASDIERVEEQNIIASVEKSKTASHGDDWEGLALNGVGMDDESPFFSEHFAVTEPNSEIDLTPVDGVGADSSAPSPTSAPARRVRFAGVSSSSSSGMDSEVDEAAFPDLLFDQEHLHPSTRQLFEVGEEENQPLSDESYWELDSQEVTIPKAKNEEPQQESSDDFSGYETDSSSGQTTDEEAVPPLTVHRPHTVLRLNGDTPRNKGARVRRANPASRGTSHGTARPGKGPCMGTWIADPSKPIGVIHPQTKRMIYIAPHIPSVPYAGIQQHVSSSESSPPSAFIDLSRKPWTRQPWGRDRKSSGSDSSNRPTSFDGANDELPSPAAVMQGSLMRIPSAEGFYAVEHAVMDDDNDDEMEEEEEDSDEAHLDINAFIDFGQDDSDGGDGEMEGETDELTSPVTPLSMQRLPTITPKRSRGRSSSQNLLEHFDKGVVSAFRRNQNRHQAVLRRPVTGTRVQAIKGGRQGAANVPISPIRKRKANRSLSSAMAPFTGINTSRLRSGTA